MLLLVGVSFAVDINDTTSAMSSTSDVTQSNIVSSVTDNSHNEKIINSEDKSSVESKSLNKLSNKSSSVKTANNQITESTVNRTNIIYVNPKANASIQDGSIYRPFTTIRLAVANTKKFYDNIIYLSAGNHELPTAVQVNRNITFIGKGKYSTIITCRNNQAFRMTKSSNLTLEKLLVQNASYSQGGAILATQDCNLIINDCYFRYNSANNGAVLFGSGSNIHSNITNSIFASNKAVRFGAALQPGGYNSVYNIMNCTFTNNVLSDTNYAHSTGGAAIYASSFSTVNVDNCTFNKNKAIWGNAILNGNHATLKVNNSIFTNNVAKKNSIGWNRTKGGAIAVGSGDSVIITNCSFTKNEADIGGAISINSGETVLIDSCSFIENVGYDQAGAINNFGVLIVKNSTFLRNDGAKRAGAILNIGSTEISVEDSIFKDNRVRTYRSDDSNPPIHQGGAITISGTCYSFSITNCLFDHNVAYCGGAISSNYDVQRIIITNTTFKNNTACYGAALYILGETTFKSTNNKFELNRALRKAGAIYINGSAQGNFKYTSFDRNSVTTTDDGDGGAIYIACYARLAFNYCSFTNNYANLKGGAICAMSVVTINIAGTNITNNNATKGSGIYLDNSKNYNSHKTKINIETSTFIGNSGKYVFYSVKKYDVANNNIMISTSWWGKNVMTPKSIYNFYQKNQFLLALSLNDEIINNDWTKNTVVCTLNRTTNSQKDLILTISAIIENNTLRYTDAFLPCRSFFIRENSGKILTRNLYVYYHLNMSLNNISIRLDNQLITINIVD